MNQKKEAFTLIELIIVVVIIGILALVAIPKYFANVAKAQRSQVYANLDLIRQAILAYYATYGAYPATNVWPITVAIDGETIVQLYNPDPASRQWAYTLYNNSCLVAIGVSGGGYGGAYAYKMPGSGCWIGMCSDGRTAASDPNKLGCI
jgi:prepilin-type N-terminal cleavage/methylation domain-containing protein